MSNPIVYAAHQPNFLPRCGYFNKIIASDYFIILDDVQIPKKGGSWINRHKLLSNGNPIWMTIPIRRNHSGFQIISEVEVDPKSDWQYKYLRRIEHMYRQARYYAETQRLLESLFSRSNSEKIVRNNLNIIFGLLQELELPSKHLVLSSEMDLSKKSTSRLVEIGKKIEAKVYLSGLGSSGYLDVSEFRKEGISVTYQEFRESPYQQIMSKNFHPSLSIVDALMNMGLSKTREYIAGRKF